MLRDRKDLETSIIKHITNQGGSLRKDGQNIRNEWAWTLLRQYNIPLSMSKDIISLNKDLSEYNEFILFAITQVIYPKKLKEYYTEREISAYSKEQFKTHTISFPIEFTMIKVDEDQYIGVTSAKQLMEFREAQLINYNADTQRALEVMTNNGTRTYRISTNKQAVNEITDLYMNGQFIPNTISLNINMDDETADWQYSEKDKILRINNIKMFDIFDGYHRYLGMANAAAKNPEFNYPMELRITNFSVSKAKQFIYQEDQKTKMTEVNSSAYNQSDSGNIVANRLNSNPESYLNGKVGIKGIVNAGLLGESISKICFDGKKAETKDIIKTTNTLITQFNKFLEECPEYLDREWFMYEIPMIVYGINEEYSFKSITVKIQSLSTAQKNKLYSCNVKVLKEVYDND